METMTHTPINVDLKRWTIKNLQNLYVPANIYPNVEDCDYLPELFIVR